MLKAPSSPTFQMHKKCEVIISKSPIVKESIAANALFCEHANMISLVPIEANDYLKSCKKIDLLIIADQFDMSGIFFYKFKTIINCTDVRIDHVTLTLRRPLDLEDILSVIQANRVRQELFCLVNNYWIYDERESALSDSVNRIKLTENENKVLQLLLLSERYEATKDYIFKTIWKYYADRDSNTIDVLLSRLKQKLPKGFIEGHNGIHKLDIKNIDF